MQRKIACFFFFTLMLSAFCLSSAQAHSYQQGDLIIVHPWARAMAQGARVGSGFMVISNKGQDADRLLEVISDIATRVEIHSMEMEGDVMKMRALEKGLEIPAGGSVTLKPGGYHVMFFNPQTRFKQGEHFQADLVFERAGRVEVRFEIEALGQKQPDHDTKYDGEENHHHTH